MGLRVSGKKELEGINISQHGEVAYSGFQMISSLGSSEMKALEEEIEELEKRKERIFTRMSQQELEEGFITSPLHLLNRERKARLWKRKLIIGLIPHSELL